jgi:hypothetical protein
VYNPQKTEANCNRTEISYIYGDITPSSFPSATNFQSKELRKKYLMLLRNVITNGLQWKGCIVAVP